MWQYVDIYYRRLQAEGLGKVLIEWVIIGLVIYLVWRSLRRTRGARVLKGVAVLSVAVVLGLGVLAKTLELPRLEFYADNSLIALAVALLIVFQAELRRGLMRLGTARIFRRWLREEEDIIDELVRCAQHCSRNRIGALVAVERDVGLSGLADNGVKLDALVSAELLNTIFYPNTALHDMGVVIQDNRIAAAGVQFPLAEIEEVDGLDASLGSRHRAAVGLSQECDAVIIVVSEQTGTISLALAGKLDRDLSPEALRGRLGKLLVGNGGRSSAGNSKAKAA